MAPNPALVFFGYWSGQLPAVTDLHFRSFLRHHPQARYELWLDEDGASAIAAPELQWIRAHPRITLRSLALDRLIEQHVGTRAVARYDRFARLRRAAGALHRRIAPQWARRNAWEHSQFGLTYKHSSLLFEGFTRDKAYRGDLARCLIALEHYPQGCVHVDLDVCFCGDVGTLCGDKGWAYRWGTQPCASAAILFLPNRTWSAALVRKGVELESFRPWILFADHVCAALGIVVHPARLFDPALDSTSLLYGDTTRFFAPRDTLALDLHALAGERHLAIHWHQHWSTVPAPTSLYAGLLKACETATS
jgi:hypothetical protein